MLAKTLLIFALLIYFAFGFFHLTNFISADEHYWLYNKDNDRIHQYWKAIQEGDWEDTRINDKPGITLAYTAGIGMLFEKNPQDQIIEDKGTVKIFNPEKTKEINFLYRFPILLLNGLFSLFFFWIIRKITGNIWVGLFSSVLILLSPILLGISQIVNPDSLFWVFGAASIFTFFAYLQEGKWKLAALSSLFLGLSLASKYVSVILFPFFFLMMASYFLFNFENLKEKAEELRRRIAHATVSYLAVLVGGMLLFALMMPASFVEPKYFYEGTVGYPGMEPIFWGVFALNALIMADTFLLKGRLTFLFLEKLGFLKKILPPLVYFILSATFIFILINWMSRNSLTNLTDVPFDSKRKAGFSDEPYLKRFVLEFVPLVFSLTPLVLFSLLYLWIKSIFKPFKDNLLIFLLSTFFLIFCVAVIEQGLLLTIRYSILLFPLSMLLAALAIRDFFQETAAKRHQVADWLIPGIFALILTVFSVSYIHQYLSLEKQAALDVYMNSFPQRYLLVLSALVAAVILFFIIRKMFSWEKLGRIKNVWIWGGIMAISVINLWLIKPFYFNYTSELLPKKYIIVAAWGYGGYEAAQYLNNLPDAKNLTLWSDAHGVCEFFVGKCIHKLKVDTTKYKIDYYFRSLRGQLSPRFTTNMSLEPVWIIKIDGRPKNFIKLFKEEGFQQ